MRRTLFRWVTIGLAALVVLTIGYCALHFGPRTGAERVTQMLHAIRTLGAPAWLGLVAFQIVVAVSGILPASLAGIAAGTLYGLWIGFGLAAVGTFAGAVLAFWFSRSMFRPLVTRLLHRRPQTRSFDAALGSDGWKLVCLLRVSPIMPFVATSYMLGLSSVSWRDYALGTLASLPALFGYVMLGSFAGTTLNVSEGSGSWLHWVLLGVGTVATIILTIHVGRLAAQSARGQPELGRSERTLRSTRLTSSTSASSSPVR